jgi:hypothetical protein
MSSEIDLKEIFLKPKGACIKLVFTFYPSFYKGSGIRDENCLDPGYGRKNMLGSGSGIKHPRSATLTYR